MKFESFGEKQIHIDWLLVNFQTQSDIVHAQPSQRVFGTARRVRLGPHQNRKPGILEKGCSDHSSFEAGNDDRKFCIQTVFEKAT